MDKPQNQEISSLWNKNAWYTTTWNIPQDPVIHSTRDILKKEKGRTNLETFSCLICLEERIYLGRDLPGNSKMAHPDSWYIGVMLWLSRKLGRGPQPRPLAQPHGGAAFVALGVRGFSFSLIFRIKQWYESHRMAIPHLSHLSRIMGSSLRAGSPLHFY